MFFKVFSVSLTNQGFREAITDEIIAINILLLTHTDFPLLDTQLDLLKTFVEKAYGLDNTAKLFYFGSDTDNIDEIIENYLQNKQAIEQKFFTELFNMILEYYEERISSSSSPTAIEASNNFKLQTIKIMFLLSKDQSEEMLLKMKEIERKRLNDFILKSKSTPGTIPRTTTSLIGQTCSVSLYGLDDYDQMIKDIERQKNLKKR